MYYAIANASAWTLSSESDRDTPVRVTQARATTVRVTAGLGLAGCLVLAFALPALSVAAGAAVLAVGVVVYAVRRRG